MTGGKGNKEGSKGGGWWGGGGGGEGLWMGFDLKATAGGDTLLLSW